VDDSRLDFGLPPELRPLCLWTAAARHSDLNDLYSSRHKRNNRLKKLRELRARSHRAQRQAYAFRRRYAPIFDNGRAAAFCAETNNVPLSPLSDTLRASRGGRFRQKRLGSAWDYSAASVIVVGQELKLNQCGYGQEDGARVLSRSSSQAEARAIAPPSQARKMVEHAGAVVWDILEGRIREHPGDCSTPRSELHRLGIQAFEPVLVEGKPSAPPGLCTAFNADFEATRWPCTSRSRPNSHRGSKVRACSARANPVACSRIASGRCRRRHGSGIYYDTKQAGAKGEAGFSRTRSRPRVEAGEVERLTPIRLAAKPVKSSTSPPRTQPGRYAHRCREDVERPVYSDARWARIFNSHRQEKFPFVNGLLKKKGEKGVHRSSGRFCASALGLRTPSFCSSHLTGNWASPTPQVGHFIGIDDRLPFRADKYKLVENAEKDVVTCQQQYLDGCHTKRRALKGSPLGRPSRARGDEMFNAPRIRTKRGHKQPRLRYGGLRLRPRFETAATAAFRHAAVDVALLSWFSRALNISSGHAPVRSPQMAIDLL